MPKRATRSAHLKEFRLWEVLPYTHGDHPEERIYVIGKSRFRVSMRSTRFDLFRKSSTCCCCGLEGIVMILDIHRGHRNPHFNLYGRRDGKLVLFTRDHILPKSRGGADSLDNYQTMCERCNAQKQNRNITIAKLRLEIENGKKPRQAKKIKHRKSMKRVRARKIVLKERSEYQRLPQGIGFYVSQGRAGTPPPTFEICQNIVRRRAYELWELAGKPADRSDEFWFAAETELFDGYEHRSWDQRPPEFASVSVWPSGPGYRTFICDMSKKENHGFYRIYQPVLITR